MASLLPQLYLDTGSGLKPASGATLTFKVQGSETPKDTYTTAGGGTANANPVVADSVGVFPPIYIVGDYDWVLKNKNGVQQNAGSVNELVEGRPVYSTYADLPITSSTDSAVGDIVETNCHTNTTAGGGNTFELVDGVSSRPAADSGGVSYVTGGSGYLYWKGLFPNGISVVQYGALGDWDGATGADDTAAFNAATLATTSYNEINSVATNVTVPVTKVRIECIGHSFTTGMGVLVTGLTGNAAEINNVYYIITVVDANNVELDGTTAGTITGSDATGGLITRFSNNSQVKRSILVPHTEYAYKLEGTVYLRKGQSLQGLGLGPARVFIPVVASSIPTFKMGAGLIGGVETIDAGGLPPSISNLATEGGHTLGAVVECINVAGATIKDMFITTASLGIKVAGGDLSISGCTIDDGSVGMEIYGNRNVITGNSFFNQTIAIKVVDGTYDYIISDNIFAYSSIQDIVFQGATDTVKGISLKDNKHLMNAQHTTQTGCIHILSGNPDIRMADCEFRNLYKWAVLQGSAENCKLDIIDCKFDGKKTNAGYNQSSTMRGVYLKNGDITLQGCTFTGVYEELVSVNNTTASNITIDNNTVRACSGTARFITVATLSTASRLFINSNEALDFNKNLLDETFAYTANHDVLLSSNNGFFTITDSGGRQWIELPSVNGFSGLYEVTYNGATTGSAVYRRTGVFAVSKGTIYDGAVKDVVTINPLSTALGGSIPAAIDVQAEIGSVGAGGSVAYTTNRYVPIILSVPSATTAYITVREI